MRRLAICAFLSALVVAPARGDLLTVLRYDTPNGFGEAAGGDFNYWDLKYNGTGDTTTDGAPLTGGVGDLTDGVVASDFWYNVENDAGTGPYVGWTSINPTITFYFSGVTSYQTIRVHVDDSNFGGVSAPTSIFVADSQSHSQLFQISDVNSGTVRWLDLDVSGIGLAGNVLSLTLNRSNVWVFSDEIQTFGTTAVPEPGAMAMLVIGASSMGAIRLARRAPKKGTERIISAGER